MAAFTVELSENSSEIIKVNPLAKNVIGKKSIIFVIAALIDGLNSI